MRLLDEITVGKYKEENPQNTPSANSQDYTDTRFHLTFLAQNMSISTEAHKIYVVCGPESKIFLSF